MSHAHSSLIYHIVYSTKYRRRSLPRDVFPRLAQFAGGIIRRRFGGLLDMNGTDNHVHVLARLTPRIAVCDQIRDIKALTSGWLHDTFPETRGFGWQEGYGAFSVGQEDLERVRRYIARQESHHRKTTFEEEYIAMLQRAGIEYDPKYVFDEEIVE